MRSIRFCFPTTLSTSTRTPFVSGPSSPVLHRACTRWGAAHRDRRSCVSRTHLSLWRIARVVRRGGLLGPVRIFPDPRFSSSGFPGPRRRAIVPLTPLSRPSRMPVRAFFRGARVPTPPRPPRLLPPRPRERAKFSPAQDAFHRQGARCSSSALSSGDCAPSSLRGFNSALSRACPCGPVRAGPRGAIAPRDPVIDPSSPSAPLATRSFAARGFDRSARR